MTNFDIDSYTINGFVCIRIVHVGEHSFLCQGTTIFQLYVLYSVKFGIQLVKCSYLCQVYVCLENVDRI